MDLLREEARAQSGGGGERGCCVSFVCCRGPALTNRRTAAVVRLPQVKAKSALEDRVHARELELVSQGEELDKLRHDVVRLSQELGQQRGRADALSSQARSVARLEAEEIARLEEQVASLRQVLDRERQLSGAMKEELERNAELLSNTDKCVAAAFCDTPPPSPIAARNG